MRKNVQEQTDQRTEKLLLQHCKLLTFPPDILFNEKRPKVTLFPLSKANNLLQYYPYQTWYFEIPLEGKMSQFHEKKA